MCNHGIRIVVTLTKTKISWVSVKDKIDSFGIEHIYFPIGSHFPKNISFYSIIQKYNPNEIFIHCEHGADRSGTFIAYMLIKNFNWSPQRALLAMLNPSNVDLKGLKRVLSDHLQ